MPLDQRKGLLGDVVSQADDEHLQFSRDFDDPIRLLDTCQKMGGTRPIALCGARLAEDQDGDLARREPRSMGALEQRPG